ncbi:Fatty acid desaturase [Enhygromyxa salina]|uniref:Fatty acid desaturase n=1 Tax=Enhygromyxa salina TaxID=215803 RepID=A0A0C2D5N5_9BACT|nr:fatty acid desaturase [Enhygromyxa salina]KIG17005.1 Fatty acid desaturase [Enhygromyxa salina]
MAQANPSADPQLIRELSQLEPRRWLGAASADWAVIALTFLVVDAIDHPLAYVLAIIPLGSRQQALGALFHDAAHKLACRPSWLNDALGSALAAWPLGLTLGGYRRYHFAHHKQLGSADDPENHHKGLLRQWSLPARAPRVLLGFVGDLVGGGIPHLLAAGKLTRPVSVVEAIGMLVYWGVIFGVFVVLGLAWVPILWVVSIATVFWSGVRLRIWTEHLGTSSTHRVHVPEWFEQLIMPHEIGLHWEHHRHPSVPFYKLRALRAALPGPPIVSLPALARGFMTSAALRSGEVADLVTDLVTAPSMQSRARIRSPLRRVLGHVLGPLGLGALIYALLRPRALLGDQWLAKLGVELPPSPISAGALAPVVGWLPSALWTYALTAFVASVWSGPASNDRARRAWLGVAFTIAIGWELGQAAQLWPGVFAVQDLLASVVAFFAALRYTSKLSCEDA